jgi:hypothetical protein
LLTKPLDQITAADFAELCAHGFEAIAVPLDVAIERGDITPPLDLAAEWDTMNKVLKALRQFSPAIEFSAFRRFYPPDVDVDAIIADA